jgi:hypothetical protein
VRERVYCTCGARLDVASDPDSMARDVVRLFWNAHRGDGHEPTTPSVARQARMRKAEARRQAVMAAHEARRREAWAP